MTKRNEPCPCGSGKKYKKCCYFTESNPAKEFTQDLKNTLQGQVFDSVEDVKNLIHNYIDEQPNQAVNDFYGLSPDEMHQLLYQPFQSPDVIRFNSSNLGDVSQVPVIFLALELAKAMEEGGVKPTAKGNLPQKLVKQIYQVYRQKFHQPRYEFPVNKEDDFYDLNVARHLMMLSGLMRKYGGKFLISKQMKGYLADYQAGNKKSLGDIYMALFKSFCVDFNWAYSSYDESYGFIQQSFGFSLYLLNCLGGSYKDTDMYGDCFIDAFPNLLFEIEESYPSAEDNIKNCHSFWVFERFARYFGLADIEYKTGESSYLSNAEVKATPLLKLFVQFIEKSNVIKGNFTRD